MNEHRNKASPKQPISPLWVIALFVSLTEVVAGLAVTQAEGGIQIALIVFVIAFPLLVAAAFFAILWWKPWVLYPPRDFATGVDVTQYVLAMKGTGLTALEWLEFDPVAAAGKRYGNSENLKNLKAWLKDPDKGNLKGVPVTFFLKGAKYAEARRKAVSEMIPTQ